MGGGHGQQDFIEPNTARCRRTFDKIGLDKYFKGIDDARSGNIDGPHFGQNEFGHRGGHLNADGLYGGGGIAVGRGHFDLDLHELSQPRGGHRVSRVLVGPAPRAPTSRRDKGGIRRTFETADEITPSIGGNFRTTFVEIADFLGQQIASAGAHLQRGLWRSLCFPSDTAKIPRPRQFDQI